MIENCVLGEGARIPFPDLVNLYRCFIGAGTFVGPFVEIQEDVEIGAGCKIESHTFLCAGVRVGNGVFVGHGVMTTNDKRPSTDGAPGRLPTGIEDGASIGSGAVLLPVRIGRGALVGAGAVVTRDVPAFAIVAGNPARALSPQPRFVGRVTSSGLIRWGD